jgi:hypothetical protein
MNKLREKPAGRTRSGSTRVLSASLGKSRGRRGFPVRELTRGTASSVPRGWTQTSTLIVQDGHDPPRTSHAATMHDSQRSTVQPVSARSSCACPIFNPGIWAKPSGTRASYRRAKSAQAIIPPAEELDQPHVAKHLKLLADFVAEVAILRVKPRELRLECVRFAQIESRLAEQTNRIQDIECPATLFISEPRQWSQAGILFPDLGRGRCHTVAHNGDAGIRRYVTKNDIAPDPPRTARSRLQRPSPLERRYRECEPRGTRVRFSTLQSSRA